MSKKGSGRNRLQAVLMDVISLVDKAERGFTELIKGVDLSIAADLANDPDLSQARYYLKESGKVEGERAEQMRASALMFLERAMEKDFADDTKEKVRSQLMPYVEKLGEFKSTAQELMGAIADEGGAE